MPRRSFAKSRSCASPNSHPRVGMTDASVGAGAGVLVERTRDGIGDNRAPRLAEVAAQSQPETTVEDEKPALHLNAVSLNPPRSLPAQKPPRVPD